ncbi:MAG: hypothetical protein ACYTGW_00100 [Planctomycetota bacterium]|jgi:hypothetical protein
MRKLSILAAALGLASVAFAQSPPFTTPPGYLTKEGSQLGGTGSGYSYYFGRYSNAHFQVADGEMKALGVKVLNAVGFRLDYRSHSTSTAMGRTWTNVTLSLAECDITKMTSTWTKNNITTPTVVHSAAVTWPSQTGNPTTSPAPWDAKLKFPFKGVYAFTAKNDLLLDYQFRGGKLTNAGSWSGSTGRSYYLDGFRWTTSVTFGRNVYKTPPGTCNDSAITTTSAATSAIQVGLYSKLSTSYPDTAQLQVFGNNTAPNAPIIKAFSLKGLAPTGVGIPIGAICNNLMIDLTPPVVYQTYKTNASGNHSPWTYIKIASLAVAQKFGSLAIWCQGAWVDSKTGNFSLTSCERCAPTWNYAILNDPKLIPNKLTVYYYDNTRTTGNGPYNYNYYNPLSRYN